MTLPHPTLAFSSLSNKKKKTGPVFSEHYAAWGMENAQVGLNVAKTSGSLGRRTLSFVLTNECQTSKENEASRGEGGAGSGG